MKIAEGLQLAKVGFGLSLDEAQQRQVRSLHAVKTTEIDAGATSFENLEMSNKSIDFLRTTLSKFTNVVLY